MNSCVAIITCHNRREKTLACLAALGQQTAEMDLRAVLFDDGSTDGTAEAVSRSFGWVQIVKGDGTRYWNGGTFDAFTIALRDDPDFYLWVNDDTVLLPTALDDLVAAHTAMLAQGRDGIVTGGVHDSLTGAPTYGGVRRGSSWWRPASFELVSPNGRIVDVDTVNGNCVLIPRLVVAAIGVNDPTFTHGIGDFDYGLRARSAGFSIVMAPNPIGACPRNPAPAPPVGGPISRFQEEWRRLTGPKGLPPRDWARFMRRWGGPLWPLFWASPYAKALYTAAAPSRRPVFRQPNEGSRWGRWRRGC